MQIYILLHEVAHISDKITVDGPFKTPFRSTQAEIKNKFKEGSLVTVYVNPDNPSSSVLIAGMTPNGYVPLMFTGLLFTCGALIIFAWYKMKRSEPDADNPFNPPRNPKKQLDD